jgi:hypothetical protein
MTPRPHPFNLARQDAGLSHHDLWLRYFALGGMTPPLELEAVCHGAMTTTDPDQIAHAINEKFTELGQNHPVPYAEDSGRLEYPTG